MKFRVSTGIEQRKENEIMSAKKTHPFEGNDLERWTHCAL
jgi:hypothetical protein